MKKEYMIPLMEVILFELKSVLTASGEGWDPEEDSTEIIGVF